VINDFKADKDAIEQLAKLAGRAGSAAGLYAAAATGPNEWGEGLLGMLAAPLDRWQELGVSNDRRAETLAHGYDASLGDAVKLYSRIDEHAAAALDKAYPDAHSERVSADDVAAPETAAAFTDFDDAAKNPRHPELAYTSPDNPSADSITGWNIDVQKMSEKLVGSVSIAGYLRDLLKKAIGVDPFAEVEKLVTGDWTALLVQGMVFEDTGLAFGKIKQNIDRGRYGIQERWQGHAGEAARAWLTDYSYACAAHAKFSTEAGWKIKNFARSAYDAMLALDIAVDALLDSGLASLLKKGESVVIGVISIVRGESAQQTLGAVMAAWTPLADAIDAIVALTHTIQSVAEMVAGNGEIAAQSWPGEPYRHPGV
jgi:hypothetical protein